MRHRIRYRRITAADAVELGPASPHTVALTHYDVKGRVRVVTSSPEEVLRVWDADTGTLLVGPFQALPDVSRVAFQDNQCRSLACFQVDGEPRLASSLNIDSVQVWDPEEGHLAQGPLQLGAVPSPHRVVAVLTLTTPSGPVLAAARGSRIHLVDATTGEPVAPALQGDVRRIVALEHLTGPDGNVLLAAGSSDGVIRLWDPLSGEQVGAEVRASRGFTAMLPFLTDGGGLAVAVLDEDVECWDLTTGTMSYRWEANWNAALTHLPEVGPIAVRIDSGGRITICQLRTGEELVTLGTEAGSILRSAFPAGPHLAMGFADRIELWDPNRWRRVTTVSPRRPGSASEVAVVLSLIALPDGRLALGLEDGWAVVDFSQA